MKLKNILRMNRVIKVFLLLFLVAIFVVKAQQTENRSSFNVDNLPETFGGKEDLKRFLHNHLIYPAEDVKNKKEGVVTLNFVVTKEGSATNIQVAKPVTPNIDKEAVYLLKLIEWIPAKKEGSAINVNFTLDIPFSISKYKKAVKERGFDTPLYVDLSTDSSFSVYETAERSPLYNNPDKTFTEFIYATMQYPEIAVRQGIEGNVKLTFVVEPDGQTSNIKIISGINGGCNNEAIRVIGLTKWQPAIRNKQYVRYRMSFSMNFSLKNNNKDFSNGTQRSWGQ